MNNTLVMFICIGSGLLHAADSVTDRVSLQLLSAPKPYLAGVKRVVVPTSGMPFNLYAQDYANGSQLLSIADKHADNALEQLEKIVEQDVAFDAIEQELKTTMQSTFNALCVLRRGNDMLIVCKGTATKVFLLLHDGRTYQLAFGLTSEANVLRLPYAATYKGVAFLRGMSLNDERVASIVNSSIIPDPELIAQELVGADMGHAVAAAYLDYSLLTKSGVARHRAGEKTKKSGCSLL